MTSAGNKLFTVFGGGGLPYLLDQNLLLAAQYEPGGWLYDSHSRATTATRVNSSGLIESVAIDVPRLQHDKDGTPLGYLHEPQATNEVGYSEDYVSEQGLLVGMSIVEDQTQDDPMGGTKATTFRASAGLQRFWTGQPFSVAAAGEVWTISRFVKKEASGCPRAVVGFGAVGFASGRKALFDPSDGTLIDDDGVTGTHVEEFPDFWRFSVTATSSGPSVSASVAMGLVPSTVTDVNVQGTTVGTEELTFFGDQRETGTAPTSYIPTTGAAATRAADDVAIGSVEFSSFWTGDPVTFVFHGSVLADENLINRMVLSNASKSRRWCYANFPGRGNADEALVVYDGSSTPEIVDDVRLTTPFKYAIAIEAGQVRGSFNGGSVGTGVVNSNLLSSVSDFALFKDHGGVCALLRIIPGAVSDAQLQSLTAP